MSYSLGLTRPDLVNGIAILSGRLLEEIKPLIIKRDDLKKLRVFISHGIDDNTLQINYARQSDAYLRSISITPTFKEYQAGHTISKEMFTDLVKWLQ